MFNKSGFNSFVLNSVPVGNQVYTGVANLSKSKTLNANGSVGVPVFTGSSNLVVQNTLVAFDGTPIPFYRGNAKLSKHPNLNAFGTFAFAYTGKASLNVSHPKINNTGNGSWFVSNSIPLVVSGYAPINSSIPLYVAGPSPNINILNLFIKGSNSNSLSSILSLITCGDIFGGVNSKVVNSVLLYMESPLPPAKSLNLYVSGTSVPGNKNSILNLFLKSGPPSLGLTAPLFLMNKQESLSSTIDLYVRGKGLNPGYRPIENNLNLFVQGFGSGSLASPIPIDSLVNLYINGEYKFITTYNSIISLFLKVPQAYFVNGQVLFSVVGATPTNLSATVPLVIYKTSLMETLPLYIHGF